MEEGKERERVLKQRVRERGEMRIQERYSMGLELNDERGQHREHPYIKGGHHNQTWRIQR